MRQATSVQQLIDLLHIDIIGQIESQHDMIRDSYSLQTYIARDYEHVKAILTHYYRFHHERWMNIDSEWQKTWRIQRFNESYGRSHAPIPD